MTTKNELIAHPLHELHVDLRDLSVPHLADYFGVWAIHEPLFRGMVEGVRVLDLRAHVIAQQERMERFIGGSNPHAMNVVDGVAVVAIRGAMMKSVPSMVDGTSTTYTRKLIRAAANEPDVKSILLHVDSPGGTVAGTYDLADDVQRVNAIKPVLAYIEDLGASAAFAVASQARRIFANRAAAVGSIGTFAAIYDYSAYAAKEGIKVYVLRAGEYKGAGTPGTEITTKQLDEWQRLVTEFNEFFVRGVSAGRRLTLARVKELADGRVHLAGAALAMGLIDEVGSFDQAFDAARRAGAKSNTKERAMSENEVSDPKVEAGNQPAAVPVEKRSDGGKKAATLAELEAALPKAGSDFLVSCLRRGDSLVEAKDAWMTVLEERAGSAEKKAADAERGRSRPGVAPVLTTGSVASSDPATGSATERWKSRLSEMKKEGLSPAEAVRRLAADDPALHAAYVAEANTKEKRPLPRYVSEQLAKV